MAGQTVSPGLSFTQPAAAVTLGAHPPTLLHSLHLHHWRRKNAVVHAWSRKFTVVRTQASTKHWHRQFGVRSSEFGVRSSEIRYGWGQTPNYFCLIELRSSEIRSHRSQTPNYFCLIEKLEFQALSGQNSRPVALKVSFAHPSWSSRLNQNFDKVA